MKGIVFVKFVDFVEQNWGEIYLDKLLQQADLPSQGIFTASALYDDAEMVTLLGLLCEQQKLQLPDALRLFGQWLFAQLLSIAPAGAHDFDNVFDFMHGLQNIIHVEVQKLHPDAILPQFEFLSQSSHELVMRYLSPRNLCFLCEGLITGLSQHIGEEIQLSQSACVHQGDDECIFHLSKNID